MPDPSYITILASNCIFDASGEPLAKGTISFEPVTRLQLPSANAQIIKTLLKRNVVNGSMVGSLQLASTVASSPASGGYNIKITDAATGKVETYDNVPIEADTDGNWDLASLETGLYTPAAARVLIVGPQGASAYQQAVAGGFTGTEDQFSLAMSALVNSFLSGNLARQSWIVADATTAQKFAISVSNAALQIAPYGGTTLAAALILADTATADTWSLGTDGGSLTLSAESSSSAALTSVLFQDTATGLQYRLTISGGSTVLSPDGLSAALGITLQPLASWILADATNGNKYALNVTGADIQLDSYPGAIAASNLYLADTVSTDVWAVTSQAGALTLQLAPSGTAGLASLLFQDLTSSLQYRLYASAGALTLNPA